MTAQEFKDIRIRHGLTQAKLAAQLGVKRRQLCNYENGTTPVPHLTAIVMTAIDRKMAAQGLASGGTSNDED